MKSFVMVMVVLVVAAMVVTLACESAVAQDQRGGRDRGRGGGDRGPGGGGFGGRGGGGDRPPGGDRGMGGGGFDLGRMTEMQMERYRNDENLGFSEDEWTVIAPLLKSVLMKRTEAFARGFGGRGRGDEGSGNTKMDALRAALEDENVSASKIESLLKAYRDDLKKKQDELKKARAELRDVLSIRQEALFVLRGILE